MRVLLFLVAFTTFGPSGCHRPRRCATNGPEIDPSTCQPWSRDGGKG